MIRTVCETADHILSFPEIYLAQMTRDEYRKALPLLHGASVGAHTRHILDGFLCLFLRMSDGAVCYDHRARDPELENDPESAQSRLNDLRAELVSMRTDPDRALEVEAEALSAGLRISSTLGRELLHNIDHAIHHLAIIRIAIESEYPGIGLPEDFGVAPSTIRYREQLNAVSG